MNATVEVAPSATTNCECNAAWQPNCNYGHCENGSITNFRSFLDVRACKTHTHTHTPDGKMTHCGGKQGPDPDSKPGCCFNYWADADAPHGVINQTHPSPDDDATHNADAFIRFVETLGGYPFLAQIAFHNCHIPFIGTKLRKADCNSTESCAPTLPNAAPYSDEELDFYVSGPQA